MNQYRQLREHAILIHISFLTFSSLLSPPLTSYLSLTPSCLLSLSHSLLPPLSPVTRHPSSSLPPLFPTCLRSFLSLHHLIPIFLLPPLSAILLLFSYGNSEQ